MPVFKGISGTCFRLCVLLALFCGCLLACERQGQEDPKTAAEPNTVTPSDSPAALPAFTPPKLSSDDMTGMPMSLEMKIASAYREAIDSSDKPIMLRRLAALYYVHGFPGQAAECFVYLTKIQSNAEGAWYYLGLARAKAEQVPRAIAAFEKVITFEQGSTYQPAYIRLADLVLPDDPARAGELYRRVIELNPINALGHYGLGRVAVAQGRPDEALQHFRKAVALLPGYSEAHQAAAEILTAKGQTEEANKHLRRVAAGGQSPLLEDAAAEAMIYFGLDPDAMCRDALKWAKQGQLEKAVEVFQRARKIGGGSKFVDQTEGALQALQGQHEQAAEIFRRLLEDEPKSASLRSNLAHVLSAQGQLEEAERLYREVLADHPDHGITLQRFRNMMRHLGRPNEVLLLLRQAIAADPDHATLHFLIAPYLAQANQNTEAIAHLRTAVELRPEFFAARHALAAWLRRQGDLAGAQAEWERTIETNPGFWEAYFALSSLAIEQRDRAAAIEILQRGIQYRPDAYILANSLAWHLATSDDPQQRNGPEAVAMAEKIVEMTQRRNHSCLDTLGVSYAEVGRFEEAVEVTRQALELATLAGDTGLAEEYRRRIATYEQKQPFHAALK